MGLLSIYESGAYGARIGWDQSGHFLFYFSFEAQSSALPGGAEGVGFEPPVLQRTVGRPILTMNGPCPLAFLSGTKDSRTGSRMLTLSPSLLQEKSSKPRRLAKAIPLEPGTLRL